MHAGTDTSREATLPSLRASLPSTFMVLTSRAIKPLSFIVQTPVLSRRRMCCARLLPVPTNHVDVEDNAEPGLIRYDQPVSVTPRRIRDEFVAEVGRR